MGRKTYGGHAIATSARAMDAFKPPRDRHVYTLGVSCPECKAEVGAKCVTSAGTPASTSHKCRRRMAIRAGA